MHIGCDLFKQCNNYKIECGNCSQNWELPHEEKEEYEDFSDDCDNIED